MPPLNGPVRPVDIPKPLPAKEWLWGLAKDRLDPNFDLRFYTEKEQEGDPEDEQDDEDEGDNGEDHCPNTPAG